MSNDFELSRRKALAALGSIGVASAGAGLGTSAYFSDQETFQNNSLTAGELDLKVDWEEHYSDWSADENTDRTEEDGGELGETNSSEFDVLMEEPTNPDGYRAFPPGASEPLIWVPDQYVDDFMDNTSIEGFPDSDNNGITDFPIEETNGRGPCEYLADVGGDDQGLDPDSDPLGRTDNDDTRLDDDSPAPLINLQDVKPGDFGEITFSTHLCDNDGYLWMNMPDGLDASESGVTEPEGDDPDEDAPEGDTVELVDDIQTVIWYDNNCDNLITCDDPIDIMAVADTSGSIGGSLSNSNTEEEIDLIRDGANTFVDELASSPNADQIRAGLLTFNGPGDAGGNSGAPRTFNRPALRAGLGPLSQFDTDGDGNANAGEFLPDTGNGNTPTPHALDLAKQVLDDQGRNNARQVIVLIADGLPNYTSPESSTTPYTVTDAEGSPLSGSGATYTSNTLANYPYDGLGGDGISSSDEQEETALAAENVQQAGIPIIVAGISLDQASSNADDFLRDVVAGDDGDRTNSQMNQGFFFNAAFNPGPGEDSVTDVADAIAQALVGGDEGVCDETIFSGTLKEAEEALTANDGRGIPLDADRDTPFDELNDPEDSEMRECFSSAYTACFGFSWWLPADHGNEVQSDSVSFDIGFYTEQCRHNDGSGMNNAEVRPEETDA
ncbi:vWA domain-containing protein [Haloplanus natans]|uniref:vWA domain-containing protein n=1 Tax=Haloplanus natans TaxID=376171 RepID=UPI0006781DEE|nr:vWA domain-containing protein [Haloplanus natans]